jgi:hypothetical protein
VTVDKALTLPAIYDGCHVLSETVGMFERKSDGSKAPRDHQAVSGQSA